MSELVDLNGIAFHIRKPQNIETDEWRAIQTLEREGFSETLDRSQAEVDRFVQWDNPRGFIASRLDPQVAVQEGRLNPGKFAKPVVVTASEQGELIGYAYVADNTSPPLAGPKMWTPPGLDVPKIGGKRWVWGREFVVDPENKNRGVAQMMGLLALETRHPDQPVAVYTLEEMRMVASILQKLNFNETRNPKPRYLFGDDKYSTTLSRWAGPHARALIDKLLEKPGMRPASIEVYSQIAYFHRP